MRTMKEIHQKNSASPCQIRFEQIYCSVLIRDYIGFDIIRLLLHINSLNTTG